ncbi:recombination regulator RecX [Erwinia sp. OLTSP20]|nr:recombination regulator RecX [Erwinia sp. OLSSP12]PIJ82078.1 recombination regulator RecX [Erwinia sp. OLCASP19]PIJ84960.1 recombination regulator RecX [Erwinia sp. OLMTSP26]PIJ86564.1 recombination regulator RecX [Erwinia sp. OLMDSP33]PIJ90206.1 recombination regulator RecX [Erwinia sp. OLFS4]PIJ92904.1 recombination regulator RecX [Erwinia sp. OLTSP20]
MRVLAMRDHSEAELRRKMVMAGQRTQFNGRQDSEQGPTDEEIEQVIAWCHQHDFLNDRRFAERFVTSRSHKGYGPQRIRVELQQKGIDRQLIDEMLAACGIDWISLAAELAGRRFGQPLPQAWKEKARVQRYLLTRGFLMDDIQEIFRNFDN